MDNNTAKISPSTRANPTKIIPTEDNAKNLLRATSVSLETIANRGAQSEGHWTDDQKLTANSIGNRVRSNEKMAYMSKNADSFEAVDDAEDHLPCGDSVASLKAELLQAVKTNV